MGVLEHSSGAAGRLWGGRFEGATDAVMWAFNASISFDRRLAAADVTGSIAYARALGRAGVLSAQEAAELVAGLERVAGEFASGAFAYAAGDEDIHTAAEPRPGEIIGSLAG